MTPRRRLLVLRHGETTYNAERRWQGQLDVPLAERGLEQAAAAAAALASAYDVSRVVSSDLSRAAVTGQQAAKAFGVPITYDERWREIDAGAWQGLVHAEVVEQFPQDWARLQAGEDVARGGAETLADVGVRVSGAVEELVASMEEGETVVIATHGVAGRAVTAALLGLEQRVAWDLLGGLRNCHWGDLEQARTGWRLVSWNSGA